MHDKTLLQKREEMNFKQLSSSMKQHHRFELQIKVSDREWNPGAQMLRW